MHATPSRLPARSGIGLKPQHVHQVLDTRPDIGFFEVHAENYMVPGGPFHHGLSRIREHYPLSLHGVGLNLGGLDALDELHLNRLAELLKRYEPAAFSEHLAWTHHGGVYFNDLLPLPYHPAALDRVCDRIDQAQERLGRRLLLENPSTYLASSASTMSETQFLTEVLRRTGCGLLLDISNAYVSCVNHGWDVTRYLNDLPLTAVGEVHLAGFSRSEDASGAPLLIDNHGSPVDAAVWRLFSDVVARIGSVPTLLERDHHIPSFDALYAEAKFAERLLRGSSHEAVVPQEQVAS
jgi:uncharacterized protein